MILLIVKVRYTYSHEFDTGSDCYVFTMYDSTGDGLTNDSWNHSEYYEF